MKIYMTKKNIHIFFEIIAIIIVVPVLLTFIYKYWNDISLFYKLFFIVFIILTLIVDGYLLYTWF